jgi:predicted NUDIX family phosphoesterase
MGATVRTISKERLCRNVSERDLESINEKFRLLASHMSEVERRRPFVVEFSGIPKAGKTGVRSAIAHLATKCGLRVFHPAEGASRPAQRALREDLTAFNSWTGMYALQNLLNSCFPVNQYDLVMLDRGIYDAICWMEMLKRQNFIRADAADYAKRFFSLREWTRLVDMVVIFECDQQTAHDRELSGALVASRLERTGPLLEPLREVFRDKHMVDGFDTRCGLFLYLDTSGKQPNKKAVALSLAEEINDMILDAIDPRYITLPAETITFQGFIKAEDAPMDSWLTQCKVEKSSKAEQTTALKQIVSYGFVEIDGQIFRLKRTGHANRPELRSKLSIGVGGHVEERDMEGQTNLKGTLRECLIRELGEELMVDENPEIELIGFLNDESIRAGLHHIAAIHRVKLHRGRVRVRQEVSDQEFGEGSWAVVPPARLFEESEKFDPWSQHIIHQVLGGPKPTGEWQAVMVFEEQRP